MPEQMTINTYTEAIRLPNMIIDKDKREVRVNNKVIILTTMEFDVLYFLASNPNIAFTKEQIYEAVEKDSYMDAAYVIRNIICRIRNKTGLQNIKSIYGYGYIFQ